MLYEATSDHRNADKNTWVWNYPAQVVLTASQIEWNAAVIEAFQKQERGYESAMKDLHKRQVPHFDTILLVDTFKILDLSYFRYYHLVLRT